MRDAVSIMDQAIASAPVEDGRPRLDAGQIRELMGTVPNAVFERVLEAVDGNRSAEVITVANQLLDAGNSPAQLARQFVRYLRNCVIAKIAGIGVDGAGADGAAGELLQISADEQRRAGRSAALFSEEELTRFLQVMLRRFDEKAAVAAPVAMPMATPIVTPVPTPIAAPMPTPVAVPMPALVHVPAEMVLTEEDAAGAALIEIGDLAEAAVVPSQVTEER